MSQLTEAREVDVIVVGAGVNGTGVARDCAIRGLRVALFERNDIAFGASGNSTGMIHGGARYLTSNPEVTRSSCEDSGYIQRIAPHLLFRVPCLLAVPRTQRHAGTALAVYDAFFELYDRYQPLKRGQPHTRLSGAELAELEPGLLADLAGGISFDEWGIDGVRLCVANVLDAVERGARVHTHCSVTEVLRHPDGSVCGVRYRDRLSGQAGTCGAPIVVNATGAWGALTATLAGIGPDCVRIRPGKGVHVYFDRRLTNYALVVQAIDGRQVFMLPWQNVTVVGTTDDDYYGSPDDVLATTDEVRTLTQAVTRVFPDLRHARALGTWASVRPTLSSWGIKEEKLSREHAIVDHARDGAPGLYSMIGGKLASYRKFAQEMTDRVAKRLGNSERCQTHRLPLPGGEARLDPVELAARAGISAVAAARLEYRHGSRAERVVERIERRPSEAATVCRCEPVTEAEVRYVVQHELARTVGDVSRRTRLGLGACGGMRCAGRCGQIVAQMTGRSQAWGQESALEFLRAAQARRLPALGGVQARQEALATAVIRSEFGRTLRGGGKP